MAFFQKFSSQKVNVLKVVRSGQLNFPSKEEPANFKDNILDKVCEK